MQPNEILEALCEQVYKLASRQNAMIAANINGLYKEAKKLNAPPPPPVKLTAPAPVANAPAPTAPAKPAAEAPAKPKA